MINLSCLMIAFALVLSSSAATAVTPVVSTGGYVTLGIKSDGTLAGWGYESSGSQAGVTLWHFGPLSGSSLRNIAAITVGPTFAYAIKSDGTVVTWGNNTLGLLGDGTKNSPNAPIAVQGLTRVVSVATGGYHTLALKVDGSIVSWGANGSGQLGDGSATDRSQPVSVPGISGVTAVAAGGCHSLALKSDGSVSGWGCNDWGELGDIPTNSNTTPKQLSGITAIAVAAGDRHSAALKADGTVLAWGDNTKGQLGDGTTTQRRSPVLVKGLSGVVALVASGDNTVALKSDGTVVAWGSNYNGQLGDGTNKSSSVPVAIPGLTDVVSIATGGGQVAAVKSDASVYSWGANNDLLGDRNWYNLTSPTRLPGDLALGAIKLDPPPSAATQSAAPLPIADSRVFSFARTIVTEFFSGDYSEGRVGQINYRYYPDTGNYIGVDNKGTIYAYGPATANTLAPIGGVSDFRSSILSWEKSYPEMLITPPRLSFLSQAVSAASPGQGITLRNTGSAELKIGQINITSNFSQVSKCPLVLAVGEECELSVAYLPTSRDTVSGQLTIETNTISSPQIVNMIGNILKPVLVVSPQSQFFISQDYGVSTDSQEISIDNSNGTAPLKILGMTITGDFSYTTTCGTDLAPGAQCLILTVYKPKINGVREGTLTIRADVPESPSTVIKMTGLIPPRISAPTSIGFGLTPSNTTSWTTVKLTNTGMTDLIIDSVIASGPFKIVPSESTCNKPVPSGGSCTLSIGFMPTSDGTSTGTITLSSNALVNPFTIPASGVGGVSFTLPDTSGTTSSTTTGGTGATTGQTGRIAIWTRDTNIASVYVDGGYVGGNLHYGATVACDGQGTITRTLSVGTHTVSASDTQLTYANKIVTVQSGQCTLVELVGTFVKKPTTPTTSSPATTTPSTSPSTEGSATSGNACWNPPSSCVNRVSSWAGTNFEDRFYNNCQAGIYVKQCIEETGGKWSCGAEHVKPGKYAYWNSYNSTGRVSDKYIGAYSSGDDWNCAGTVPNWNSP